ncbi:MAG: hypothetical protein IKR71_05485, partial [Bacteroidales bacterium]|nr:hypothetical protein [Bacteroidales bacterium]
VKHHLIYHCITIFISIQIIFEFTYGIAYEQIDYGAYLWSATSYGSDYAFGLSLYSWGEWNGLYHDMNNMRYKGFSVRCLCDKSFYVSVQSESNDFVCGTKMKDYDGNEYNTVKIGEQCWMKENMRSTRDCNGKTIAGNSIYSYTIPYRYAPDGKSDNVAQYGYLYNWPAATKVCPKGWHLPTREEFETLRIYCGDHYSVDGNKTYIAKALAAKTGWSGTSIVGTPGNNLSANNASGFSAVPAGYDSGGHSFGYNSYLWSATRYDSVRAYRLDLGCISRDTGLSGDFQDYGFSVRCLRDN